MKKLHLPKFKAGRWASLRAPQPHFFRLLGQRGGGGRGKGSHQPAHNEHSDGLTYALLQLVGEVEIGYSSKEGNDSDASSGETNMAHRFRTLGQKRSRNELVRGPTPGQRQEEGVCRGPLKKSKKKTGGRTQPSSLLRVQTPSSANSYAAEGCCRSRVGELGRNQGLDSDATSPGQAGARCYCPGERCQLPRRYRGLGRSNYYLGATGQGLGAASTTLPVVELVDPLQAYSPLVLPGFNEEELLEEEVDEVPEKASEVANNLSQKVAATAEDSVAAAEDGAAAEEAFPNFSHDL
ncbi:hypothetical protein Acr_12g0000060 [Actinidia rufa]|uniref:Uncharacterized protein n=1 Tax=Actinidia rufa TaxID=165716 RepID=A0A7J0FFM5_9ERIC|nr:hypothetical protein Acr_12g0000060 [Actinidia rufa]